MSQDTIAQFNAAALNELVEKVGIVSLAQRAIDMIPTRELSASAARALNRALTRLQTSQYGQGHRPTTFAEAVKYGQGFVSGQTKWTLIVLLVDAAEGLHSQAKS